MGFRSRGLLAKVVIATLAIALTGCGSDGDGAQSATADTSDSGSDTTTTTTPIAEPATVEVGLADFSFDIPDTLTAGPTKFVATNAGNEEHHMTLVKLKDGQTLADVIAVLSGDVAKGLEENELVPGPQAVAPGATQSAIVDLEPGRYVALCAIPGAGGVPHAAMGMIKELTVESGDATEGASAIPTGPKVTLRDFNFELPADFDGQGTFRVENPGSKPHEMVFYKVADGSTYDDAVDFLTAETRPAGEPPVTPSGGVTAMSPGQLAGMVLDLEPGTYVALCFLPSTDGQTHFQHGMMQKIEIT